MNTTSNVTPISENPKQPQQRQTFKDIIAENVKSLIEQLEAGHSDALTAYLDAVSRFHNYSFRMLAILSFPTLAGGAWLIVRKHPKMFQLWGLSLNQKSYYDPRKR